MSHISIFVRNASKWRKQDDPPPPCYLRNSQNFYKIDSFLKLVLTFCVLDNLIVGWSGWFIKEGAGILPQIFRFSGGVNVWGRIYQIKSWYSLVPSQTSKVNFFAEIVFGCRLLTFFVKDYNLDAWLVPQDASEKHFLCFVRTDFASWKKRNIYTRMLDFIFPSKKWLIKGWSGGQKGGKQ